MIVYMTLSVHMAMRCYCPFHRVLGFACSLFPATTGNYVALGTGYALGGAAGSSEVKVAAEGKGSSKELV
tara:strand:- start:58 stop:267 length:210 start_codon:yes stop_codon:yes gene_type:complete